MTVEQKPRCWQCLAQTGSNDCLELSAASRDSNLSFCWTHLLRDCILRVIEELFPFQREGVEWLTQSPFRLLADEMGLGKSAQTIVAADQVAALRVLVIGPAISRLTWWREFERWSILGRQFSIPLSLSDELAPRQSAIVSFEYAVEHFERIRSLSFDVLIIDEVHFLKSIEAKRAKKILGSQGIVHSVKRVWVLSGTPAPNHADELWILLCIFGVTKLSYDAFVNRYCEVTHNGYDHQVVGTKKEMIPEIREMLGKIMLRRRKADVLKELPPVLFSTTTVEPGRVDVDQELERMAKKQRLQVEEALSFAKSDSDKIKILEALAPSVSTLRRYTGLQKVEPVAELIAGELAAKLYDKIVIFAFHKDVIELLAQKLRKKGCHPVVVTGDTPPLERQKRVDAFQAKNGIANIFLGNILAAGTNLTLTVAHHVTLLEWDWVPGNNRQAIDRTHRIGQKLTVNARFISLPDSLDQKMTQVVAKKTRELEEIFRV